MFDDFFEYFFQDIGNVFVNLFEFFISLFNFAFRFEIIQMHADDFSIWEWALTVLVNLIFIALIVVGIYFLFRLCKRLFRFGVSPEKYDELLKKVRTLQRDLIRANYEKDKLIAMRVAELGGDGSEIAQLGLGDGSKDGEDNGEANGDGFVPNQNRNTFEGPCVDPTTSRFFRLTSVDNF